MGIVSQWRGAPLSLSSRVGTQAQFPKSSGWGMVAPCGSKMSSVHSQHAHHWQASLLRGQVHAGPFSEPEPTSLKPWQACLREDQRLGTTRAPSDRARLWDFLFLHEASSLTQSGDVVEFMLTQPLGDPPSEAHGGQWSGRGPKSCFASESPFSSSSSVIHYKVLWYIKEGHNFLLSLPLGSSLPPYLAPGLAFSTVLTNAGSGGDK